MLAMIRRAWQTVRAKKRQPLHIEFNLTDYCNLNCKGCTHYSPIAPAEFQKLESLEREMRHLAGIKNADIIKEVYLIGGETLLYPHLNKAIEYASKYFPDKKISIFTNGLLLPKMDEEFWTLCRRGNCTIALTRYPIKFDYDKMENLCREKGVNVEVFGDRGEDNSFFRLPLDPGKRQRGRLRHFQCMSFGCLTIDGGKIFPCSQAACVGHLNRRFGSNFRWEEGDYLEVEKIKDAREILKLRNRPVPFCRYCRKHEVVSYGPSTRSSSEWIEGGA